MELLMTALHLSKNTTGKTISTVKGNVFVIAKFKVKYKAEDPRQINEYMIILNKEETEKEWTIENTMDHREWDDTWGPVQLKKKMLDASLRMIFGQDGFKAFLEHKTQHIRSRNSLY
jgi:hypothetical protein